MPWSEKSIMSQRHEFVMLFEQDGVNRRELCRRFGISPTVGYRLWARYRQEGHAGLADRSRRPQRSPRRSSAAMEALVVGVRAEHPAWGGRKIRRRLQDLKHPAVPSASMDQYSSDAELPSPTQPWRAGSPPPAVCMDGRDSGRVFGDMVDALYRHCWPVGEGLGCRGRSSRSCRSGMSL